MSRLAAQALCRLLSDPPHDDVKSKMTENSPVGQSGRVFVSLYGKGVTDLLPRHYSV